MRRPLRLVVFQEYEVLECRDESSADAQSMPELSGCELAEFVART